MIAGGDQLKRSREAFGGNGVLQRQVDDVLDRGIVGTQAPKRWCHDGAKLMSGLRVTFRKNGGVVER